MAKEKYKLNPAFENQTVSLFVTCEIGRSITLTKDVSQKALEVLYKIGHPASILIADDNSK